MKNSREQRRLLKYREFTDGDRLCCPLHRRAYRCPLCLVEFPETAVLGDRPTLNEEHCVPNGLGARTTVLACETCNNVAGRIIDHHLHKSVKMETCFRGDGKPVRGTLVVEGQELGISIQHTNSKIDIRVSDKVSNPSCVAAAQDAMKASAEAGITPGPMKLHFGTDVTPDPRKVRASVLKSAYLLLFREIGYCGIETPGMEAVRTHIRDYKGNAVPTEAVIVRKPLELLPHGLSVVTTAGLESFAVPVRLTKFNIGYLVFLPFNQSTFSRWDEHHKSVGENNEFHLDCLAFDRELWREQQHGKKQEKIKCEEP